MVTTYYAVRLLCHIGSEYRENINRAKDYILAKQKKNGSWTNSVIETSAAILALRAIGEPVPVQAREWLLSHKQTNGWTGEPVLYYWYELDDKKLFYHCTDKGQVTTAWATLALKNG
jgi:squalene cyclase